MAAASVSPRWASSVSMKSGLEDRNNSELVGEPEIIPLSQ